MFSLEKLKNLIIVGDINQAAEVTGQAIQAGLDIQEIIDAGLIAAMDIVGQKFSAGELYIPEMLLSAKTMQSCMHVLRPFIVDKGVQAKATVVFGTVQGDVHDIGKNLVIMMMEGAGFEVHDLGTDVGPEKFGQAVEEYRPDLLCMSALLTTTQGAMGRTIQYLQGQGFRQKVKVMVGGAPITEDFSYSIGADGYAPDAASAVLKAKELLGII